MATQLLRGQLLQTCPLPTTDLTGRTYIVTGSNSGLGLDAAKHLYRLNCSHIILAVRDTAKGEQGRTEILSRSSTVKNQQQRPSTSTTTSMISVWPLDMASYASVQLFANQASTLPHLHGVVLNAGVFLNEFSTCPESKLETTLTVNVTATFLLAILLLPTLRRSGPSNGLANKALPHITIVGSAVHHFANHHEILAAASSTPATTNEEIKHPIFTALTRDAKMKDRYFLSKLLVMLLTVAMTKHMNASDATGTSSGDKNPVILNCVSPGYCRTSLFRHEDSLTSRIALVVIGRTSEEGSRTLVHGVVDAGWDTHGKYLSECQVKKMSKFMGSEEGKNVGEKLWEEVKEIAEGVQAGCTTGL